MADITPRLEPSFSARVSAWAMNSSAEGLRERFEQALHLHAPAHKAQLNGETDQPAVPAPLGSGTQEPVFTILREQGTPGRSLEHGAKPGRAESGPVRRPPDDGLQRRTARGFRRHELHELRQFLCDASNPALTPMDINPS